MGESMMIRFDGQKTHYTFNHYFLDAFLRLPFSTSIRFTLKNAVSFSTLSSFALVFTLITVIVVIDARLQCFMSMEAVKN
uniref:Neur_chan_LBD domain-containing protein n=1 Tax=Panagrellus redivivus TaxID=6233 RepID=A0A7E4W5B4_PANRE